MSRKLFFLLVLVCVGANARIVFVDNKLTNLPIDTILSWYEFLDTAYGTRTYNPSKRAATGGLNRAYNTLFNAFVASIPGDTIQMRAGTYTESLNFIDYRKYTLQQQGYLMSYPGEWAIIKGTLQYRAVSGSQYWNFLRFEISGGCISIANARHMTFQELYVHDNPAQPPGNEYVGGGITLYNSDGAAQNNLIRKCWLINNGNENIKFFGDYYSNPAQIDTNIALMRNEICYNYLRGAVRNIHYKNAQFLCKDNTGQDMSDCACGDKIHHNFICNSSSSIILGQDFLQVYCNIFQNMEIDEGERSASKREPFYIYAYNNLFVRSSLTLNHNNNTSDLVESYNVDTNGTLKLHPYSYMYNNVFFAMPTAEGSFPIEELRSDGDWKIKQIDLSTVHIGRNLFYPFMKSDKVMIIGYKMDQFSIDSLNGFAVPQVNFASTTGSLFSNSQESRLNAAFVTNGNQTIQTCGINVAHTYLKNVTIPSYIGPFKNATDDWLDSLIPASYLKAYVPVTADSFFTASVKLLPYQHILLRPASVTRHIARGYYDVAGRRFSPDGICRKNQLCPIKIIEQE
jgi:hypothetical protein